MIRVANGKTISDAEFIVGSADKLPYPDGSFDIVACSQSFHHYPYPEKAMLEAKRVLKPGGLYILSDTGIGGVGAWIDNHILFKLMKSGDCHTGSQRGDGRGFQNRAQTTLSPAGRTATGGKPS